MCVADEVTPFAVHCATGTVHHAYIIIDDIWLLVHLSYVLLAVGVDSSGGSSQQLAAAAAAERKIVLFVFNVVHNAHP